MPRSGETAPGDDIVESGNVYYTERQEGVAVKAK